MALPLAVIIRQLARAGLYYGIYEVLWKGERSKDRLRYGVLGVALLLLAVPVAVLVVGLLALALFFGLAEVGFVEPALITAAVLALILILLVYQGWRMMSSRR